MLRARATRSFALLLPAPVLSLGLGFVLGLSLPGCKTGAGDAEQFAENFVHNYCYLTKKCSKYSWNENEYDDIEDCADDVFGESDASDFEDACQGYDEQMGKDCLAQLIRQYNSCTPEHDCDDGDYDRDDNPCDLSNLCPDGYQGLPPYFGCI